MYQFPRRIKDLAKFFFRFTAVNMMIIMYIGILLLYYVPPSVLSITTSCALDEEQKNLIAVAAWANLNN